MQVIAGLLTNFKACTGAKSNSINLAFWSVAGIYDKSDSWRATDTLILAVVFLTEYIYNA